MLKKLSNRFLHRFFYLPNYRLLINTVFIMPKNNFRSVVANYRFGTWNIGTLKGRSGEVCEVLHRRKVKVCCIQDVRWKGEGSRAL